MSVSPVGPPQAAIQTSAAAKTTQTATAPDGDPLAVEKAETAAKQQAEKANGGFVPNKTPAPNGAPAAGGVNKLA